MVLLTSEIYKAILQTFNSQPPAVRFDSLAAAVLEDSASSLRRAAILSCHFNFSSRVLLVQSMTLAKIVTVMLRSFPRSTSKSRMLRVPPRRRKRIRIDVRMKTFILSYFRADANIYNHNLHDESARKRRDTVA